MDKCLATRQCNRDLRDAVLQQSSVSHDHVARQSAISIELPEPRTEKAKKVAEINETLFQIKERDRDQPPPHSSKTSQFVVPMTSAGKVHVQIVYKLYSRQATQVAALLAARLARPTYQISKNRFADSEFRACKLARVPAFASALSGSYISE